MSARKKADRKPTRESAEIGRRFASGDPAAAEEVRRRVRRTLAFDGYGIPSEDRRDLEQTVMAQIWEAVERPGFDPAAGFWGLVRVVAARRCLDWRRSRREEVPLGDGEVSPAAPEKGETPLDSALRHERRTLVAAVMGELPEGCRELIRLHLEQGRTYAELAEVLGVREGALRVRMHRCIRRARVIAREMEKAKKPPSEV